MPRSILGTLQLATLGAGALLLTACGGHSAGPAPLYGNQAQRQQALAGQRHAVVQQAQRLLGAPYRYGGNGPRGFDCSGLVQYSHARAGIAVPRMARDQRRHARPVAMSRLQAGDLLFFELAGGKGDHVGIYVGGGEFIHAPSSGKRVSRARLDAPYWRDRLVSTGSYL